MENCMKKAYFLSIYRKFLLRETDLKTGWACGIQVCDCAEWSNDNILSDLKLNLINISHLLELFPEGHSWEEMYIQM